MFFFFPLLLLVLYLAINTAGQMKHLQTFEKQVLLPLLRSVRSKDLSKISYAETCVWLYFCVCEKVQLRWYECFLTNPSRKGQKDNPFQGSSSYLPDNRLRTRKVICWSCLFLLKTQHAHRTLILKVWVIFERKTKRDKKNPFKNSSVQLLTWREGANKDHY